MHKLNDTEIEDIQNGKSILLDVRTIDEYNSGHAAYSVNIPLDVIEDIKIDKDKKIFVYCQSGNRSKIAEKALSKIGYDVVNVGGLYEAIDAIGEA